MAEKEKNDKDITEQINLILDKNVERKCEEYEHELSGELNKKNIKK